MRIIFYSILLFSSFILFHPVTAQTQEADKLFNQPPPGSVSTYERKRFDPTIVRERAIQVNFGLLTDNDYLAEKSKTPKSLELNFFNDVSFSIVNTKVVERTPGDYSWFGKNKGDKYSDVIIVVKGDIITGYVFTHEKQYQVRTPKKGVTIVREINTSNFPDCEMDHGSQEPIPQTGTKEENPPGPGGVNESGSIIDILIVYTQAAAQASADIAADAQAAVDATNLAYSNSGATQRVRLVHSAQVTYPDRTSSSATFTALKDVSDGNMDNAHTLRNTYGADIVTLLVENFSANTCGLGSQLTKAWIDDWANNIYSNSFDEFAFNVVKRSCAVGNLSVAHELGHNMGAQHDRKAGCAGASYPYSCGYVDPAERFRTVMAYQSSCATNIYCPRLPYFSTPNISHPTYGAPFGVSYSVDPSNSADNTRVLDNTVSVTSSFRPTKVSATIPTLVGPLTPDIKANGSDGPITITGNANLAITVALGAGGNTHNADWWVLATVPGGAVYYFYLPGSSFAPGSSVTHIGPLFDLGTYQLISATGLPSGVYTVVFAVDLTPDGAQTSGSGQWYSDSVTINVQ